MVIIYPSKYRFCRPLLAALFTALWSIIMTCAHGSIPTTSHPNVNNIGYQAISTNPTKAAYSSITVTCPMAECNPYIHNIRPGKVDSLFLVSHFLDFVAGVWPLFIIHYWLCWSEPARSCSSMFFSWKSQEFQNHVLIRGRGMWKGQ